MNLGSLCKNSVSWPQPNIVMVHGLASVGYFDVKKTMPLGGGLYSPGCTSGEQSRAGCPSSHLLAPRCPPQAANPYEWSHCSGWNVLSTPPHMLHCSRPSFRFQIHLILVLKQSIHLLPAPICGLLRLACLSLYVMLMSLFVSGDCKIAEGRSHACLVHFHFPRHRSCHRAECSKYLSETVNFLPF